MKLGKLAVAALVAIGLAKNTAAVQIKEPVKEGAFYDLDASASLSLPIKGSAEDVQLAKRLTGINAKTRVGFKLGPAQAYVPVQYKLENTTNNYSYLGSTIEKTNQADSSVKIGVGAGVTFLGNTPKAEVLFVDGQRNVNDTCIGLYSGPLTGFEAAVSDVTKYGMIKGSISKSKGNIGGKNYDETPTEQAVYSVEGEIYPIKNIAIGAGYKKITEKEFGIPTVSNEWSARAELTLPISKTIKPSLFAQLIGSDSWKLWGVNKPGVILGIKVSASGDGFEVK